MVVRNILPPDPTWDASQIDLLVTDERRACRRLDDAELMHYGRMAKASLDDPLPSPEWFRVWMRARVRAVSSEWKWRNAEVSAGQQRSYRDWIDEAKARIDLNDLMNLPARSRVVHCPLHDDRAASLSVNAEKGLWNCFGCGASGDVLTWLALVEGLDWADALDRLEHLSGLQRPQPTKGGRRPLGAAIPA